jgi:glutamate-1-semialdehyde 2,1-aminomutase
MASDALTTAEHAAIDTLIAEQEKRFLERQRRSADLYAEACQVLAGGGTSSWQIARPQMIWLSHGHGSHMIDADGHEYVDMHGGYRGRRCRSWAPRDRGCRLGPCAARNALCATYA